MKGVKTYSHGSSERMIDTITDLTPIQQRVPRSFDNRKAGTTGEITFTGRHRTTSVIKTEYVDEEYHGWQQVKGYLNTLPTRRIVRNNTPSLIIKFCPSDTVNDLTNQNDQRALNSFDAFFGDLINMWEQTRTPYDESRLKRNYSKIGLDVIPKFKVLAQQRLGIAESLPIVIDGSENIGSIQEFFDIQRLGFSMEPPIMVLSHGDENLGNVLSPRSETDGAYRVIDARFAGYYDPAWVLGNIYARTYLFNAQYPKNTQLTNSGTNEAHFSAAFPTQTTTTETIKQRVIGYIQTHRQIDPTLAMRTAAYVANNIGRSIAFLRDKSFSALCEAYGIQHFLTAMREAKRINELKI